MSHGTNPAEKIKETAGVDDFEQAFIRIVKGGAQ